MNARELDFVNPGTNVAEHKPREARGADSSFPLVAQRFAHKVSPYSGGALRGIQRRQHWCGVDDFLKLAFAR